MVELAELHAGRVDDGQDEALQQLDQFGLVHRIKADHGGERLPEDLPGEVHQVEAHQAIGRGLPGPEFAEVAGERLVEERALGSPRLPDVDHLRQHPPALQVIGAVEGDDRAPEQVRGLGLAVTEHEVASAPEDLLDLAVAGDVNVVVCPHRIHHARVHGGPPSGDVPFVPDRTVAIL